MLDDSAATLNTLVFLDDIDVLCLALSWPSALAQVSASCACSGGAPATLLQGGGSAGLWRYLALREVAACLRELARVELLCHHALAGAGEIAALRDVLRLALAEVVAPERSALVLCTFRFNGREAAPMLAGLTGAETGTALEPPASSEVWIRVPGAPTFALSLLLSDWRGPVALSIDTGTSATEGPQAKRWSERELEEVIVRSPRHPDLKFRWWGEVFEPPIPDPGDRGHISGTVCGDDYDVTDASPLFGAIRDGAALPFLVMARCRPSFVNGTA